MSRRSCRSSILRHRRRLPSVLMAAAVAAGLVACVDTPSPGESLERWIRSPTSG